MGNILRQYEMLKDRYEDFAKTLCNVIVQILKNQEIHFHSVTYRIKEKESLERKFSIPGKKYSRLADITDIAGIRIITYFEDDVNRIADLVEQEFDVDIKNSIDKRKLLDPDRFGYLSRHQIISLKPARLSLIEYSKFPELKAEIQTRSILQHAWAEIEHGLGYKSNFEVPEETARKLFRLSGILEGADQEFISVKKELATYKVEVLDKLQFAPEIKLNKDILLGFTKRNGIVIKLDRMIAKLVGAELILKWSEISKNLDKLQFLKVETLNYLDAVLMIQLYPALEKWAVNWFKDFPGSIPFLPMGISIDYLCLYILAGINDDDVIKNYLETFGYSKHLENEQQFISKLRQTYELVK